MLAAGPAGRRRVYYLDTGLLFEPRTRLRDETSGARLRGTAYHPGLRCEQAALYGDALWDRDPDTCCGIRKVGPNAQALADKRAWITGVRRDQSTQRAATPVIEWNAKFGLVKVAPLSGWTQTEIWDYIRRHDVPYNRLHDEGYPSLGCNTRCTSRPWPGEPMRSGRWRGMSRPSAACTEHLGWSSQWIAITFARLRAARVARPHDLAHRPFGAGKTTLAERLILNWTRGHRVESLDGDVCART